MLSVCSVWAVELTSMGQKEESLALLHVKGAKAWVSRKCYNGFKIISFYSMLKEPWHGCPGSAIMASKSLASTPC